MCVVRGDIQRIRIGTSTNIQDGTVIHVTHDSRFCPGGLATLIGDYVTVGHKAVLHACTIEGTCLVGMNATVMDGAVVAYRTIVGAGSTVAPNTVLQSGYLYVGTPARQVRPLTDGELEFLDYSAENYVRLKERHRRR
jgi:carbonic anhydrase/acetyltransferase-like protein (isoleucine patch superfamily)